ncbi:hypothetical protein CHISP_1245 [Chitinispirillum alkaliphilum]|nr:hypothetical protein CHISP_1245 [Chitinispirillum alkaliphilum]
MLTIQKERAELLDSKIRNKIPFQTELSLRQLYMYKRVFEFHYFF